MLQFRDAIQKTYFLLLLPVFFVLHGYMQNYPAVPAPDAFRLGTVYFFVTLVFTTFSYFFFRSWKKAALFIAYMMGLQFFFGLFHDTMKTVFPGMIFSRYSFILPLLFITTVMIVVFLLKSKREFTRTINYLNITLAVLIIVDSALLGAKVPSKSADASPSQLYACDSCKKPNIYLLLLDEYAGRETLKDLFSFDNSAFEKELQSRGFHVFDKTKSNYNYTPFSMASLFSMDYLPLVTDKSNNIENQTLCQQLINNNNLVRTLKSFGYDFVNVSMFHFADEPNDYDKNNFYSTRDKLINAHTLTARLKKDLWFHFITTYRFDWAIENFEYLLQLQLVEQVKATTKASKEKKGNRFVYTHFIMPHYPYLYDKDGRPQPLEKALNGGREEYLGFLQYGNKLCLELIDNILKNDRSDPIILVMSDHGFTKYGAGIDPSYNFKNMVNIRMPENSGRDMPDSISNVNVFRMLLNRQFNQKWPMLKDSSFFLKEY